MIIQSQRELELLREGGKHLALILSRVAESVKDGVTTKELDTLAEKLILECGGTPSFKNYQAFQSESPFPASLCVSVNDEIVHGIPSGRILKDGDIVGLDIGMKWPNSEDGLYTDTALTVLVGEETEAMLSSSKLIVATKKSLDVGISVVRAGVKTGDIGFAIQQYLEKENFGVVRELVGHGVGIAVHEDPEIPNWGKQGTGEMLVEGEVIALEPMATEGKYKIKLLEDDWTWSTADGSLSAHFEHTLVVTKNGVEILTKL
jgi:methionyl aminopeptidase